MQPIKPVLLTTSALLICVAALSAQDALTQPEEKQMIETRYLEIVTPEPDKTCELLAEMHGVEFSEPVPALGNARTADTQGGGRIAVRAPMHGGERPVVRPYLVVDDVDDAFEAAKDAGAETLVPPTDIPDQGRFALYFLGNIEHGLWQR